MGRYVMSAFGTVLSNAFSSNSQAEYLKNPILKDYKEQNKVLSEEEKQQQISLLFSNLEIMKHNFELTHGEKPCQT